MSDLQHILQEISSSANIACRALASREDLLTPVYVAFVSFSEYLQELSIEKYSELIEAIPELHQLQKNIGMNDHSSFDERCMGAVASIADDILEKYKNSELLAENTGSSLRFG